MSNNIFQIVPLQKKSLLQRVFKQNLDDNAVICVNNLLATKPIRQINTGDIETIELEYGIDLTTSYSLNLEEFYATYLGDCLSRNDVSDTEQTDLHHLKTILRLPETSVSFLHEQLGKSVFKKRFESIISDGRFSNEKEASLMNFASRIGLPKTVAEAISTGTRKEYIKTYVGKIIADQRFSPDEEKELENITTSLRVDLSFDSDLKWKLQKLKLYWELENRPLPVITPDIVLQKNELCHIQLSNVSWYELRVVTQRVGYSGYRTSIKIAKGFYLRSGSYTPTKYTSEQMKLIDTGTLYLTNKRIIFAGRLKNSNIRLEKIIDFVPYNDGVEIRKDAGRSPLLKVQSNADVFCIILGRLLNGH